MPDLTQRIIEIERNLLETDSSFEIAKQLRKRKPDKERIRESCKIYGENANQFIGIVEETNMCEISPEHPLRRENALAYLAIGVFTHDLTTPVTISSSFASGLEQVLAGSMEVDRFLKDKYSSSLSYENVRNILVLPAYILSGDKKFLPAIKTQYVPDMLKSMLGTDVEISYDFSGAKKISLDKYFIILQLAKNAKKYAKTKIDVKYEVKDGSATITVSDTGNGIPADKLPDLFGDYTTEGTGLGLQIVKKLVDMKKGYVKVDSTQPTKGTSRYDTRTEEVSAAAQHNQGTTFRVYLPKKN
ncbi:sensor histidine kinase [Candidatus Woesearchaeota archaeon]|nr:sensor histidine kinase [Candidatus Woesearchaeota archaeon]